MTPYDVTCSSSRRVWWLCKKGHAWEATVAHRYCGSKCPYCSNARVCPDNCLATVKPEIAKEWHPTKNGKLSPKDIVPGSSEKVWWKCSKGHEWRAIVRERSKVIGCPYCNNRLVNDENCFAKQYPGINKEWHPTKNGKLSPKGILPRSTRYVWWKCKNGHEWEEQVRRRALGSGCVKCNLSLDTKRPKLIKEWHPTKNKKLNPKIVGSRSDELVWWKCKKGHEWQEKVSLRSAGKGCPYCLNKLVCKDNCLAAKNNKLAKEWHPTKNGKLTPADVLPKSQKKAWWQCKNNHEWSSTIYSRNKGIGCPRCKNRKILPNNNLAANNPKIAKEWHPKKNGKLTPKDVLLSSQRRVWWQCKFGHKWQRTIKIRTSGKSPCPFCSKGIK